MQHPGPADVTVLVPHDHRHTELLDRLVHELLARGYEVRRGAPQEVARGRLCLEIDIAVATSRVPVDADTMSAMARLHTVVIPTTGIESVAMGAATKFGVAVANGATRENVVSMAEATLLLILGLLYRLPAVAAGWSDAWPRATATMLNGKTVGLIGYGAVAQAMVPRLQAFEAALLVHSTRSGLTSAGVEFVDLPRLLERADVVCVVGALNDRTRHLIGPSAFGRMKRTAFIVNTARGAIVDEAALCDALASQRIAGAALDAFETEPLPPDSPLRRLPNVILTPHCIGHTRELSGSFLPALLRNIDHARLGELPPYCKNPEVHARWRRLNPAACP